MAAKRRQIFTVLSGLVMASTLALSALAAKPVDSLEARLDRGFKGGLEVFNVPGISAAILKDGKVVYAKGFGYANRREGTPAGIDTLYYIGSTTKTFTATLAMILRDRGIVDLDTPVKHYLPGNIPVPADPAGKTPITLRHLLSHTAGLPKDPPNRKNIKIEGPVDPSVWDEYNTADLYAALAAVTLQTPVGTKWHYSNMGMALAGHVLERAAKKPFEALLKQLILEPLDMRDTSITLSEVQEARLAAFYWHQEGNKTEQPRARFGELAAMGGMTSSVRDMAKYAALQLKMTDARGDPISRASLQEMRQPIIRTDRVVFGTEISMGLGWWIRNPAQGGVSFEHGGEIDGHSSAFWFSPQDNVAAIVLCNTASFASILWQEWLIRVLQEGDSMR